MLPAAPVTMTTRFFSTACTFSVLISITGRSSKSSTFIDSMRPIISAILFSESVSEKSVKYGVVNIWIPLLINIDKSLIGFISCILIGETMTHLMSFCFIIVIRSLFIA